MASGWRRTAPYKIRLIPPSTMRCSARVKRFGHGESERYCQECGEPIPEARRKALIGVRFASPARPNKTKTRGRQPVQPARQQRQPVALALSAPFRRSRSPLAPSVHHES